jgi:hypothetical protein
MRQQKMRQQKSLDPQTVGDEIASFASDARLVSMGPGLQVTVELERQMSSGERGHALMDLEAHLRASLGASVEIYLQPMQDANALRQRREKIQDWVERRGSLKLLSVVQPNEPDAGTVVR